MRQFLTFEGSRFGSRTLEPANPEPGTREPRTLEPDYGTIVKYPVAP